MFTKPSIFCVLNYSVDKVLDTILSKCIDSGIKSYKTTAYFMNIDFNNGINAVLWNANKYYAWISEGYIGTYSFRGVQPSKKTMRKLNKEIEKYFINTILK